MTHHPGYLENVSRQRRHLLARLATERTGLLWQLIRLDEKTLVELPVFEDGDWTAKDLMAHVAAWDEVATERIELLLAGREEEIAVLTGAEEDARNAACHAERKEWPLQQAAQALVTARTGFLAALARLSDEKVHRPRRLPAGETSARVWTEWRARHDAAHIADLVAWREERGLESGVGPRPVLLAALTAARDELLVAAALISPEERASRPVCGGWTLKDVLAHVADWEWLGMEGLRYMAAGRPAQVEHVQDVDAWNQVHSEARRDEPWEEVWADFHAAREALMGVLDGMSQADLSRPFPFPWGQEGTPYQWLCIYVDHDRQHARDWQRSW